MTTPGDERNLMYTNAEEEVFIPECDLVLTITEDGESSRAFSTINQVSIFNQSGLTTINQVGPQSIRSHFLDRLLRLENDLTFTLINIEHSGDPKTVPLKSGFIQNLDFFWVGF